MTFSAGYMAGYEDAAQDRKVKMAEERGELVEMPDGRQYRAPFYPDKSVLERDLDPAEEAVKASLVKGSDLQVGDVVLFAWRGSPSAIVAGSVLSLSLSGNVQVWRFADGNLYRIGKDETVYVP